MWGEDNAAQLYRVTVDTDRRTIRFLTEPRDEYLRPRLGQTVELLRGDVLLPNYERVAELDGDFFRVTGGYQVSSTPGAKPSITSASDVDQAWLTWLATVAAGPATRRRARRGTSTSGCGPAAASRRPPTYAFTAGTARTLVGTGLTVTFDGATLRGDGWTRLGSTRRPDAGAALGAPRRDARARPAPARRRAGDRRPRDR